VVGGHGVAIGGYVLQALALSRGSLLLVQPVLVSSLLFALPLSLDPPSEWVSRGGRNEQMPSCPEIMRLVESSITPHRRTPADYTAGYPLPDVAGNTNFGTNTNKLVTITTNTGANRVYVYNANNPTTATAYPGCWAAPATALLLPSRRSSPSSGWRPPRPIDRCADAPVNSQPAAPCG